MSRVADRCLSLVHTPDDETDAARTASMFLGTLEQQRQPALPPRSWDIVSSCRSLVPPDPGASRYSVPVAALARCSALSLLNGTPATACNEQLGHAQDLLARWLNNETESEPQQERRRFGDLLDELTGPLIDLPGQVDDKYREIVAALFTTHEYDLEWAEGLTAMMRQKGLHLTGWERHSLSTLMTFFDE